MTASLKALLKLFYQLEENVTVKREVFKLDAMNYRPRNNKFLIGAPGPFSKPKEKLPAENINRYRKSLSNILKDN